MLSESSSSAPPASVLEQNLLILLMLERSTGVDSAFPLYTRKRNKFVDIVDQGAGSYRSLPPQVDLPAYNVLEVVPFVKTELCRRLKDDGRVQGRHDRSRL